MKRSVFKLIVFLLLGAIINVAVAWGCAYFIRFDWRLIGQSQRHDVFTGLGASANERERFAGYAASRDSRFGSVRISVSKSFSWGPSQKTTASFAELVPDWSGDFLQIPELRGAIAAWDSVVYTHDNVVEARGWPCLSLWGGVRTPRLGSQAFIDGKPIQVLSQSNWAIVLDNNISASDIRFLPFQPLWPGFAINTFFYAAIVWALFAAPAMVRRRVRRKRGQCASCGYSLRGTPDTDTCPECGAAA